MDILVENPADPAIFSEVSSTVIHAVHCTSLEPLPLTMSIDWVADADYHWMNGLRTQHYPPNLLVNPAHLGLFTRLRVPVERFEQVLADIEAIAAVTSPFEFICNRDPMLWGKTVAIPARANALDALRASLNRK